ncbi:MAG TPA: PPK2 family polyphosphate kinase [Gammaproteobacteria bacterium]|nr:PPK2 family polyphosphate kinase [Gammaproteobacteria bacterium]
MFEAKEHSLLVPFDGTFDARKAPTAAPKGKDKDDWKDKLEDEVEKLGAAQERLYADGRYAVLIVFQALDAAGKDGTIRHVFTGVNPVGLRVAAFKQPTPLELAHDFLWRTTAQLPERGSITIFNRSYYEEVLVVRVHPEYLAAQRLPDKPSAKLWAERLRAIADHERYLAEQGTVILKFWLNVSKAEQRKRFLERIDEPKKNWKFNEGDLDERDRWDDYIAAYDECLRVTSRPWAPWYAIPADDKHYQRWSVAKLITSALDGLGVDFPRPDEKARTALTKAKARLLAQSD